MHIQTRVHIQTWLSPSRLLTFPTTRVQPDIAGQVCEYHNKFLNIVNRYTIAPTGHLDILYKLATYIYTFKKSSFESYKYVYSLCSRRGIHPKADIRKNKRAQAATSRHQRTIDYRVQQRCDGALKGGPPQTCRGKYSPTTSRYDRAGAYP